MKSAPKPYRDGIFLVTTEQSCPLYSVGDELKVEAFSLSVSDFKPGCLQLSNDLSEIVTAKEGFSTITAISRKKTRFNCGGCTGEEPTDQCYGQLRAALERQGQLIGPNDMLIAAHALALDCVMVTANQAEFARVPGLRVENWLVA